MRLFLVLVICLAGALGMPSATASSFEVQKGPQNILPQRQAPKINNKQATAKVRQVYAGHKILGVQLIESKGPPVYRVKTLSDDGVVKYVFVDGTSGDLFE